MAEGVEGSVDDVGAALFHFLIAEAHAGHAALAVVFDHNVGGLEEFPEYFAALFLLQVDLYAALAPVYVEVAAEVVGAGRVVDFDHIGAELAESAPAGGAGEDDAEVQDANSLEGGQDFLAAGRCARQAARP